MSRLPKGLLRTATWKQQPGAAVVLDEGKRGGEGDAADQLATQIPAPSASKERGNLGGQVVGFVGAAPVKDARVLTGLQSQLEEQQLREKTREVLQGQHIEMDEDGFDRLVSQIRRANSTYEDAFESLLETGRLLNVIQQSVGPGGYRALTNTGVVRIGESNASKLRQIAGAVDSGKIPPSLVESMPRNLSGAYVIATLPADTVEPTMRTLLEKGVLPNAPVRTLEAAVKGLRAHTRDRSLRAELAHKRGELARLRATAERLAAEIREIEEALREQEGGLHGAQGVAD